MLYIRISIQSSRCPACPSKEVNYTSHSVNAQDSQSLSFSLSLLPFLPCLPLSPKCLCLCLLIKPRALGGKHSLCLLIIIGRQVILSIIHLNILSIMNVVCLFNSSHQCKNFSGRCLLGKWLFHRTEKLQVHLKGSRLTL